MDDNWVIELITETADILGVSGFRMLAAALEAAQRIDRKRRAQAKEDQEEKRDADERTCR